MAWRVVIAGGGFAGLSAARRLEKLMPRSSAQITLINDTNFLLYTPFLPEAAAGTLEPRHVVTPLRDVLDETQLRIGAVMGHDPLAKSIEMRNSEGQRETFEYDELVVAIGSISRSLPVPGLGEHAVGFKSLADAIWLRNHIIQCLEMADATSDQARAAELLSFVFVGGGYAGLEALAELQDFAVDALEAYPRARQHPMRWILVEATDRVMPEIDRELANYTLAELKGRGIDFRLETTLTKVEADFACLSDGETIPTRTVVWTAGVKPNPVLRRLNLPLDDRGRVVVDRMMQVEGQPHVWALGDCAAVPDAAYSAGTSPPTAQHAIRQGRQVARNVAAALGVGTAKPFSYESKGQFVNLGRYKAVAKVGNKTLRGFPAWFMARSYHMSQIPGGTRKARAIVDWTVGLPFNRDIAEMGSIGHPLPLGSEPAAEGLPAESSPPEGDGHAGGFPKPTA